MHPNYSETRRVFVEFTLKALAQEHPLEVLEGIKPALKERIATTYTDEVLAAQFRQMAAEKRAKEAQEAAQWAKDLEAKKAAAKVKRDHQDRLDREKAATAEAEEEAATWKKRANTLEYQFGKLMQRQKGG
jgi:hypothetical protein